MKSLAELKKLKEEVQKKMNLRNSDYKYKIVVGMGTSGIAMGAREVMRAFLDEISKRDISGVVVTQSGEKGASSMEPVVDVLERDGKVVTYCQMSAEKAKKVISEHIVNGNIISEYLI